LSCTVLLALLLAASPVKAEDPVRVHLFTGPSVGLLVSYSRGFTLGYALDVGVQFNRWFAIAAYGRIATTLDSPAFLPQAGLFVEFTPISWFTVGPGVGIFGLTLTTPLMLAVNIPGPAKNPRWPCWRIQFELAPLFASNVDGVFFFGGLIGTLTLGIALM
jgi:hypothetical protein